MEVDVVTEIPVPPRQSVVLELSVEEFGVLYLLHREGNGGLPEGIRGRVESGMDNAFEALDEGYQKLIQSAYRECGNRGYPAERITRAFNLA